MGQTLIIFAQGTRVFILDGYQLKAEHFPPFWFYGNSTIKQNLSVVNGVPAVHNTGTAGTPFTTKSC